MTSGALITAETASPTLRPRSSTASFVIDDVIVRPGASSSITCAVVEPFVTAKILPGRTLRALSFMTFLQNRMASDCKALGSREQGPANPLDSQSLPHTSAGSLKLGPTTIEWHGGSLR